MRRKIMFDKIIFNFFLCLAVGQVVLGQDLSPIVQTAEGAVQGTIKVTSEGNQFFAYQGIPFAKPPVGALRFKSPQPAEPWTGVLQVTFDPPPCMQPTFIVTNPASGVEDCLQLNVYTPQLPTNESNPLLPVHVFIHGGAFIAGDIDYHDKNPERYIDVNIIVVTIKYRLAALGFLSTDDEAATGNAGLYDQNLALKWVQRNIASFGGNTNDVTLTGQSAGGASVIYQYLSPMSAGLFNRVISESGTPISDWAMEENPVYFSKAMGEHFNCTTDNSTELINCLQQVSAENITGHSADLIIRNLTLCWVPSIETSPSGQFLTEDPLTMLTEGNFNRVPLQLGFNRDEGVLIYEFIFFLFQNLTAETFDFIVPVILDVLTDYTVNLVNISHAIEDQYYSNIDLDNQTQVNIATIKWMSDIIMKSGISQTAALVSSHGVPTYLYAYDYVSSHSSSNFTGEPDITHGNELQYLWYRNILNDKDIEFGNRFFSLWSSFMINGRTNRGVDDQWLQTPPGQYNYYDINEQFIMRGNYDTVDMDFWWTTVPAIANS